MQGGSNLEFCFCIQGNPVCLAIRVSSGIRLCVHSVDDRQEAAILKHKLHTKVPVCKFIGIFKYRNFILDLSDAGSACRGLDILLRVLLRIVLSTRLIAHIHGCLMSKKMYIKSVLVEYCLKGRSYNLFKIYDVRSMALSLKRKD